MRVFFAGKKGEWNNACAVIPWASVMIVQLKWPHMWRLATIAGTTAQAGITEVTPISWAFAYQSSYYCMEEICHMLHNLQNAYNLYCGSARMPDKSTDVRENYTINVSLRKMTILQNLLGVLSNLLEFRDQYPCPQTFWWMGDSVNT